MPDKQQPQRYHEPPCPLDGLMIVLAGSFNPTIFHPAWLSKNELVSEPEASSASVKVIAPELAVFAVGPFRLVVTQDRFQLEANPDAELPARDLVLGIFGLLEHTPVTAMGLGRHMHFSMNGEAAWHNVGHTLVPKDCWRALLDDPGTRSVVVRGRRQGASSAFVDVNVEPSVKVAHGVYVGTNEHFGRKDHTLSDLLDALSREWEAAQRFARESARSILKSCWEKHNEPRG